MFRPALNSPLNSNLTLEEKRFSGLKASKLNRKKILRQFRTKQEYTGSPFGPPFSFDYYSSSKCISELTRTYLDELRVNIRAVGCHVFLHVLEVLMEDFTIKMLVEDQRGDVALCYFKNHIFLNQNKTAEGDFPPGTVIVIKEPRLKLCIGGSFAITVDCPTDLAKVIWNHSLFNDAVSLGWKDTKEDPTDALGWKKTGDELYRLGNYTEAIGAYLVGLKYKPELKESMMLHLNLTASYLVTKLYESCLEHAREVLRSYPENDMALFRAGRSYYELRQYENSKLQFEKILRVSPSDLKAMLEMQRCEDRLREQDFDFELHRLRQNSEDDASTSLDFADGVRHVEIAPVLENRRRVIATNDVRPGTILVAEKAVSASWGQEFEGQENYASLVLYKLFYLTVSAVFRNPKHMSTVLELPRKTDQLDQKCKLFCDEETQSELTVDVARIMEVVQSNTLASRYRNSEGDVGIRNCVLFTFACHINCSCLCNCTLTVYNDVAVIRTCTFIKKGEEITVSHYLPRELITPPISSCSCALCGQERSVPRSLQMKRRDLLTRFNYVQQKYKYAPVIFSFIARKELSEALEALESTYRASDKYTLDLFKPYLIFAKLCLDLGDQYEAEFMHYADKALRCLGLSSEILLRCAENKYSSLPKGAVLSNESMLYSVCMCIAQGHSEPPVVFRWLKVLKTLDKLFNQLD